MTGVWARASLSRKLLLPLLAVGSRAAGGAGAASCHQVIHQWFDYPYEYMHVECWVVFTLIIIATVFELCWHHIQHMAAGHHGHGMGRQHDKAEQKALDTFKKDTKPLGATIAHRASGELMVLGFLAFVVWCFARAGFFNKLNCDLKNVNYIGVPSDPHEILETVEDVHMHLFLGLVMFIAINAFSAIRVTKIQEEWQGLNTEHATGHAERPGETKMLMNSTHDGRRKRFAGSRYLFARRMQRAALDGGVSEDLCQVLVDAAEAHTGQEPEKEQYAQALVAWFPFDQYVSLQVHRSAVELVEIKLATWVYLLIGFVLDALLIQATRSWFWYWTIGLAQLGFALFIGCAVPLFFNLSNTEKQLQQIKEDDDVTTLDDTIQALKGARKAVEKIMRVQAFPMWSAQVILFCWSFGTARVVASRFWWDQAQPMTVCTLVIGGLSIPFLGVVCAEVLARMSIWIARGDLGIQDYQLEWVRVIANRKIAKVAQKRHAERRKTVRKSRSQSQSSHQEERPSNV